MKRVEDLQAAQLAVCVVLIAGSAVFMWPSLVEPFMLPKMTLMLVGCMLLLGLEVARWLVGRRVDLAVGWWLVPLGAFVAALVVATAVSETSWLALFGRYSRYTGLLPYVSYVLVLLVMARIGHLRLWLLVAKAIIVALGVVTLYTFLQTLGADPFQWPATPLGDRFSTMGNINFSAAYLGITLAVAASLALTGYAGKGWRLTAASLVPLGFVAAVLSLSIQGPVAAVVGLGFLGMVLLATQSQQLLAAARRGTGAVLAAAAAAALLAVAAVATTAYLVATDIAASLRQRVYFWEAALDMFQSRPVLGVGLEGFANTFLQYRSAEGAVLYGEESADAPHSVPLAMLADGGLLLALPYVAFVLVVGFCLVQGLRRVSGDERILLAGFGGLWLAYHVQSAVSFDVPPLALLHYVSAAAILALSGHVSIWTWPRRATPTPAAARGQGRVVTPTASPAVRAGLVLVAVTVLAGVVLLSRPLRADLHAVEAAGALRNGQLAAADQAFSQAIGLWPWEPKYRSLRGSLLAQTGEVNAAFRWQSSAAERDPGSSLYALQTARIARDAGRNDLAARWFAEAAARDPVRPAVLAEAGRYFFSIRDLDRAVALLERARNIMPAPEPLLLLGQARYASGDIDAARAAFQQALAVDPGYEPAVAALAALEQNSTS